MGGGAKLFAEAGAMFHVGTSGWQYPHWRAAFYPSELAEDRWLEHYAARFQSTEVNNTFYNLPEASIFEQWALRTPQDFTFALKMSRFLTHLKRLRDPEEPVQRFLERAKRLGAKRGPTLVQLPPNLKVDTGRLDAALKAFGPGERVAVEFRHESWFVREVRSVLERRGAALCLADGILASMPCWRTAEWGYVRFHHGRALPPSCYGRAALKTWTRRLASIWPAETDVFAYFNNDAFGCAVRDAVVMAKLAAEAGLWPTRVPALREARLGSL
jgi:uncharacterized protein YecE (DUF72 family)